MITFPEGKPIFFKLKPGGGPAERAGIREGDEIVRLDTIKAGELNAARIYELCLTRAGKAVEVEVIHPGESDHTLTRLELMAQQWSFPPENPQSK